MTDVERIEHRVRALQTAVLTLIQHFGLGEQVAAAESARLDEVRFRGEAPAERLIELYSAPGPRSSPVAALARRSRDDRAAAPGDILREQRRNARAPQRASAATSGGRNEIVMQIRRFVTGL